MARQIALVLLLTAAVANPASAQLGGLKKLKDAAKKAAGNVADSAKAKPAAPPAAAGQAAAKATPAGAKVWENYDFVPGNKVLFYTDFTEDKVGNFARRLKYSNGPIEIVELNGAKVLRATGRSQFLIPVGRTLPERFTLEIDAIAPLRGAMTEAVSIEGGKQLERSDKSANVTWNPNAAWIEGSGQTVTSTVQIPEAMKQTLAGNVAHLRILMDGAYFKMYVNERRLYNIPELAFRRDSLIRVLVVGEETDGNAVYITSIRVAESETDVLYDALANKGRWATQGILFETGKAELKPESHSVLKEIAATMKQHGDLKILIEGHTDNVGSAASNLTLSDARAASVKQALVSQYGIEEGRMTTQGLGDTKPVMPNTTAEGRAQNRRVEIVKQ